MGDRDVEFAVGKTYRTRGNHKITLVAKSVDGQSLIGEVVAYPVNIQPLSGLVRYQPDGKTYSNNEQWKLISEWKEPKIGTHWLNVYCSKEDSQVWYGNYRTRQMADATAASYEASDERIACIDVPWVEGQGLEAGK